MEMPFSTMTVWLVRRMLWAVQSGMLRTFPAVRKNSRIAG